MNDNLFEPGTGMEADLRLYEEQVESIKRRLYEGERTQEVLALAREFNVQVPDQLNG